MTDHIKIPDIEPVIHYHGDNTQTQFIFPFPVLDAAHLVVMVNGAKLASGYTVSGIGQSTGGTVTFGTAPPEHARVTLQRVIPVQRISDFMEGGELSSNALNNELDLATSIMQELQQKQKRALHYHDDDPSLNATIPHATDRANRLLGFDENGDPLLYDIGNSDDAIPPATYTQDGAGAITRPLTAKAKEHVSVMDFGAVADGITDDSAAFINALAAHTCVHIPSGRYAISQSIHLTGQQTLYGCGTSTVLVALSDNFDVITIGGSCCHVHDLAIEGGDTGLRICCDTVSTDYNRFNNIHLTGQHIGIELDGNSDPNLTCNGNTFSTITIQDCEAYGVLITRNGFGTIPSFTRCGNIDIVSDTVPLQYAAFAIESGHATSLMHCSARIHGPAALCFIGTESDNSDIYDFHGITQHIGDGVTLQSGSHNTFMHGCTFETNGTQVNDSSNGSFCSVALNDAQNSTLRALTADDVTTRALRKNIRTLALPGPLPFYADLSHSVYMVNAQNGEVVFFLPKANVNNKGFIFTIKKTDTTDNMVIICEATATGPDQRQVHLGSSQDRITVISDGTEWRIIESNIDILTFMTVTTAGTHSVDPTRNLYLVNASAGTVNMVLPAPANTVSFRRIVTIKKIDSTSNPVIITTASGGGPDTASYTINTRFSSITVACIGSTWYVIGKV